MNVRQGFQDLILLLKRERKAQVIAAVVVIFVVWGLVGESRPRQRTNLQPVPIETGASTEKEAVNDLVTSLQRRIEAQQAKLVETEEAGKRVNETVKANEEKMAEILTKVIERMADLEKRSAGISGEEQPPVDRAGAPIPQMEDDGLNSWGDIDAPLVDAPLQPQPKKVAIIGAGDSVRVKLLAGVNAPTDGTPYPVVFELADNIDGPDGSALPLGGARLIAAAQGSLSDQRALFRLTTLNVRFPDGSRKVLNVDGWVVGEDGIRGMEGILIDPLAKALAGSLLAGTVEGLGEGIASANQRTIFYENGTTQTFVDGETFQYAAGKGLNRTGEKYSEWIDKRMDLLVPHVKVLSGREATAVFSSSVTIDGLFDSMDEEELLLASLD